jgi:hypothetical protein
MVPERPRHPYREPKKTALILFLIDFADIYPARPTASLNLLRSAAWHRQRHNPLQHAAKQPPRQMTLRQEQPVLTGVLYQAPGRFSPAVAAHCSATVRVAKNTKH